MIDILPTAYHGIGIGLGALIFPRVCWWRRLIHDGFFVN
jgi:hypothetical protein